MGVLTSNIMSDQIEVMYDIRVERLGQTPNPAFHEFAKAMTETIISAADREPEWFGYAVHEMRECNNATFDYWLEDILTEAFSQYCPNVGTFVAFHYGCPEAPIRIMTFSIETLCGAYRLKIIDRAFGLQYKGVNPEVYDKFLRSSPASTNGYSLLNKLLGL